MANGVRYATAADVRGLMRLHARCSTTTLQRRFLAPMPVLSTRLATALLMPPGGFAMVCEREGELVAHIMVAPFPDEDPPTDGGRPADAGLLVEDAWQRRGVGSSLLRSAVKDAPVAGFGSLRLTVHPDNRAVLALVNSLGLRARIAVRDGYTHITLPLGVRLSRGGAA